MRFAAALIALCWAIAVSGSVSNGAVQGYYRQPSIHGSTIVFVAEGDLWKVSSGGGVASRLTSHPGEEGHPTISADGKTVAFLANYEGPTELYTMPLDGGRPERRTFGWNPQHISGWTSDGELLFAASLHSTLPNLQLYRFPALEPRAAGVEDLIPLAQAADGCRGPDEKTLYFTRLPFQGSHTKRYRGGTAQQIWSFRDGAAEAVPLTADHDGTSKNPMCTPGQIYFASDRDGTMNLWSMSTDGAAPRQHTHHAGFDLHEPSMHDGRIVYQLGADLHVFSIADQSDLKLTITLDSDLDQTREKWIDKPLDWLTASHLSPDGNRVVLTARGKIFVAPTGNGRLAQAGATRGVRYRDAQFLPDGKTLLSLSDESGEVELWTQPANGVGESRRLTRDGEVLRWEAVPSPDGKWVAHYDKNHRLFLHDVAKSTDHLIEQNPVSNPTGVTWSSDSRWLAYASPAANMMSRVLLYELATGTVTTVTSDRYDSYSPIWGPKGDFLYLLSDRNLTSVVPSPWGSYQPEPFLDKRAQLFHVALRKGLRSPFRVDDELTVATEGSKDGDETDGSSAAKGETEKRSKKKSSPASKSKSLDEAKGDAGKKPIEIDLDGIERRLTRLPFPSGNYSALTANDSALFWLDRPTGGDVSLMAAKIENKKFKVETVAEDIAGYELSMDGKKLLIRKPQALYVVDAGAGKADLTDSAVPLAGWALSVVPQEEWRQMFLESWRLERDYFYDPNMHGVNWTAMLDKYRPLVDRVAAREELADLMAQMVAELSALHTFVRAGDTRTGPDNIRTGYLGAQLVRDVAGGGFRVKHIYRGDPQEPWNDSPLADPLARVAPGDVITAVNGTPVLSVREIGELLRNQSDKQVLLRVASASTGESHDAIVVPLGFRAEADLRYREWEVSRRDAVEAASDDQIGYVHLRAMGGGNFSEWARDFYPAFNRKGLIIDVRHNRGGNIDSWILGRLLRKAWFGWSQRAGHAPSWNMQYAFRGHIAVLVDERTASDGEAFAEGIQRLELGTVFGTRTWGGEIWLTSSNRLVDRGIATASEFGVYGPEGEWLIEGHGVVPDVEVDNLPHETFNGRDRQLEAALDFLKRKIESEPIAPLLPPVHPDKSFDNR